MNSRIVAVIMRKDWREFTRNRFFVFITVIVLVAYAVVFWVLPASVDETVRIGVHGLEGVAGTSETGLELVAHDSEEALRVGVEEGTDGIVAGIAFPEDFVTTITSGEQPRVVLFVPAGLPIEQRNLMEGLVTEAAFAISGSPAPIDPITEARILGVDRVGDQVSLQEQMRPLLLILVLMVETFALSSLVAIEVQQRTVSAGSGGRLPHRKGGVRNRLGLHGSVAACLAHRCTRRQCPVGPHGSAPRRRARDGIRDDRRVLRTRLPRNALHLAPVHDPVDGSCLRCLVPWQHGDLGEGAADLRPGRVDHGGDGR